LGAKFKGVPKAFAIKIFNTTFCNKKKSKLMMNKVFKFLIKKVHYWLFYLFALSSSMAPLNTSSDSYFLPF
jgi:hypothetical protein